ncbi:MAG: DNA polymerase/3'-5' exonuclease PolX [Ignavibacteriales bacterium]|nr:DNA polymerase/3'-5' exonuclease PolX [Ignavibacteriales bacterium]
MNKNDVANILHEMGTLFELKGENRFKCIAFHNAANTISALTQDLSTLVADGKLTEIKGIGKSLASDITELVTTGKLKVYDELKSSFPAGITDLLRIQGMGPKKVKVLWEKLGIGNLQQLKEACEQHKLATLEGFGAKTEENILNGLAMLDKVADKHLFSDTLSSAQPMLELLKQQKGVVRVEVAGSLRRKKEIIGDIDILVSAKKTSVEKIMEAFTSHENVQQILGKGETKSSVLLKNNIQCDVRVVDDSEFPFALAYFTGSKEHNVEMRTRAKQFGLSLNEYGFSKIESEEHRGKAKQVVKCKDEEDIFNALELAYIPPELRENNGELEIASKKNIPTLLEEKDLHGTFHCHTTYSDGKNSLEEMIEAARNLGFEYFGIADHSQVAAYANGLSPQRVKQQHKHIDEAQKKFSEIKIFKGTEVDILKDGSLDFDDKTLSSFDYVVASVHSSFKMSEEEMTKRIVKALKNKYVTFLGHSTGRLLLQRDGYPLNLKTVIDVASDYGKGIEINAHPVRLDLDWRWCKYAKEKGVKIPINPDAHSTEEISLVKYGVNVARKGWLEKSDVVNAWNVKEVEKFFESVRK